MRFAAISLALSVALCPAVPLLAQGTKSAVEREPFPDGTVDAFQRGDYPTALALLENGLAQCEANAPKADECLDLLLALANVASLAGDAQAGEAFSRAALELAERVLPPDHPNIATSYNNLAANLNAQGRYAEAEPLFRKALAFYERVLPPDHPDIATGYNNLASNLNAQGRYAEAEPLYRKALAFRERVLPPDHPSIASSYNNLASNLDDQGRYAEAEPLFRKALAFCERVLPADHPDIARSYNNLALNLNAQGRYAEAEPLHRKALTILLRLPAISHPDRIDGNWAMASLLRRQTTKFAEARSLYREAERGVLERVASYRDFGPEAEKELQKYKPIFTGQVSVAWKLTQQAATPGAATAAAD